MVCLVQTVVLPWTNTNSVSKWTKTRFHMTHGTYEFLRVRPKLFMTNGMFNANCAPILCSTISKRNEQSSTRPSSPRSNSGAPKMIYDPIVRLTQTEHLSCTTANTVWKHIKMWFYMTHVTSEFHRVPPIVFPSLRNVRGKPCINLASSVALSPNVPNRASTWASSPKSPIECIQNDFYAYGTFSANCAPILHWH
jgi:hypothetical protein